MEKKRLMVCQEYDGKSEKSNSSDNPVQESEYDREVLMPKITDDMTKLCYESAKAIYPDNCKITFMAKSVHESTGMAEGSAKDYIRDFFLMRDGKKLGRCMKESDAKFYFESIYADFGADVLSKALDSLDAYLESDGRNHQVLKNLIQDFKEKI